MVALWGGLLGAGGRRDRRDLARVLALGEGPRLRHMVSSTSRVQLGTHFCHQPPDEGGRASGTGFPDPRWVVPSVLAAAANVDV